MQPNLCEIKKAFSLFHNYVHHMQIPEIKCVVVQMKMSKY